MKRIAKRAVLAALASIAVAVPPYRRHLDARVRDQ
jgi:hypothetical protein